MGPGVLRRRFDARRGRLEPVRHPCQLGRRLAEVVVLERLADGDRADAAQRRGDPVDGQVGRAEVATPSTPG